MFEMLVLFSVIMSNLRHVKHFVEVLEGFEK